MKEFKNIEDFLAYTHEISLKEALLEMGEILEDDFHGSKISCIFHDNDKTPSLQITDRFFKCYGCDAKGDLVQWIRLHPGLSFIEAINMLTEHFGVKILDQRTGNFNKMQIKLKKEWEEYLKDMNEALNAKDGLSDYLRSEVMSYFPQPVGYDKRSNYIVLAFTSKTGAVLGFTKRRVDYPVIRDKQPKWLHSNTNDSLIANANNLYNLSLSSRSIKDSKSVIFVEGPRDVAAMQRAGMENVLAISGTSNFSNRVMETVGYVENVIFALDGDNPGKEATLSAIRIISKISSKMLLQSTVMEFPEGKDPADLSKEDIDLTTFYNNRKNAIAWYIENAEDSDIRKFYKEASDLTKPNIALELMRFLSLTRGQLDQWLSLREEKIETEYSYKDQLMATIGKSDNINVPILKISEVEAKKILKLRFGVEV